MADAATEPGQHVPTPEVAAAAQSGNAAQDIVAGLLGKYANPATGGIDEPQVVQTPVASAQPPVPTPTPAPAPVQPAPPAQPTPPPAQPPAPPPPPAPQTLADRYSGQQPVQQDAPIPDIPQEQQITLPQDENDRSGIGHAFAASRAESRQYRQLAEQFKQRLEAAAAEKAKFLEEKAALEKQILDGQTKAKSLEDQIGKLDLERSPAFQDKYDKPVLAIRDQLAQEFERNGLKPDDAANLANSVLNANTVDEVPELLASLPNAVQGMAIYKWQEATGLFNQRDQALTEWRQTQTGLEQVNGKEAAVMTAQRRQELCDTGFDRVSKVVTFWSDPAFDKYRQAQEGNVKAWYSQASDDQLAAAAIEGALVAPFAYAQIEALQNLVAELQGRLQGHTRLASPPVAPYFSGSQPPPPPPPAPKPDPQAVDNPVEAAEKLVATTAAKFGFA